MDVESLLRTLADPAEPTGGDSGRTFVQIMQGADEDPRERRRIQRLADLLDVEDAVYAQALDHLAAGDDHAAEPLLRLAADAGVGEAEDHLARLLANRPADATATDAATDAAAGTPGPSGFGGQPPAPDRPEWTSVAGSPDDLLLPAGIDPHADVRDDLGLRFRYSTVTFLTVDLQGPSLFRARALRAGSFRAHRHGPSLAVLWAEEVPALGTACTFNSRFVLVPPARDLRPIDQQTRRVDRLHRPAARTAAEVMRIDVPVPVISAETTVHAALERLFTAEAQVAAVEAGSELVGVIGLTALAQRLAAAQGSPSIERVTGLIRPADFVPPDAPIEAVRRTLARDPGGIVVVRGRDGRRLGYITAELLLTSPDKDDGSTNNTLDQPGTATPVPFPARALPTGISRRATAT
ncbi:MULTISPECIES: hypothetical protein [Frankia]|uniref:CBS domain-containing protein n=1 Tax=Frankia alni (strain DSM 45986 / CECT 9034 / ACN14a) TaxID=326424 RepID=Q0RF01_FRAAA|nr:MULTISPECIES: hypothetical protein [Frankia]CAJ63951.1 hypothetical protein; putative CBS-domain [Frankia alni ACN14a]